VRAALQEWGGSYTGYAWSVRFQQLNEHQLDGPAHVYVFLNRPEAPVAAVPAKVADFNELRLRPNYCGSASGFNDAFTHAQHTENSVVSRAVDLTDCLIKAGMAPDVPPADPSDPSKGPARAPVRLSDLKLVAVDSQGVDVTHKFDFGDPVISWSLPVTRTAGQVRVALAAEDPAEARVNLQAFEDPEAEMFSIVGGVVHEEL
jgi:hypothetical protein